MNTINQGASSGEGRGVSAPLFTPELVARCAAAYRQVKHGTVSYDAIEAALEASGHAELFEALTDARDAIASLPASTLGTATICDHNGDPEYYPIQAELLDKIDCALAKARGDR